MRMHWLACSISAGCGATLDGGPAVRIEPATIDITAELGSDPPAPIELHVFETIGGVEHEVTRDASIMLTGAPLGAIVDRALVIDRSIGGAAAVTARIDDVEAASPVIVKLRSLRSLTGVPSAASNWLAGAADVWTDAALEPGDGAVLPPSFAHFDIDFAAADSDDVHEIVLSSAYLDVRVIAPGVPGPRHVALTADEWQAISRTSRGSGVELGVRSLASTAPATARAAAAHLAITDRDLTGGLVVSSADQSVVPMVPALWRYDLAGAVATSWMANPHGGCLGCHVSASLDGGRLVTGTNGSFPGAIIDAQSRTVVTWADPSSPWTSAAYDPRGRLVTGWQGNLTLRDGTTAAPIVNLTPGVFAAEPTIAPDGSALAYAELDTATYFVGPALRVHPWNGTQLGPARELTRSRDGLIVEPQFSPDSRSILYSLTSGPSLVDGAGVELVAADGLTPPTTISADGRDGLARWVGPIAEARADDRDPEPVAWIAFVSTRSSPPQLWLTAYFPDRRTAARPFHLPGQASSLNIIHAPFYVP